MLRTDLAELEVSYQSLVDLDSTEFENDEYKSLKKTVSENKEKLPNLEVFEGRVYKHKEFRTGDEEHDESTWKLWIPKALTPKGIEMAHCTPNKCHGGVAKRVERLKRHFYWTNMTPEVSDYIYKCVKCQSNKAPNVNLKQPMVGRIRSIRPFQTLYMDIIGP